MPNVSEQGDARLVAELYSQCLQLGLDSEAALLRADIQHQIKTDLRSTQAYATTIVPLLRDMLGIIQEHAKLDQVGDFFTASIGCIQSKLLGQQPIEVGSRVISKVLCNCTHACRGLNAFLIDQNKLSACFNERKDLRSHMEDELRHAGRVRQFSDGKLMANMVSDGVDLKIEKSGNPQGLVVTKSVAVSAKLLEDWHKRKAWIHRLMQAFDSGAPRIALGNDGYEACLQCCLKPPSEVQAASQRGLEGPPVPVDRQPLTELTNQPGADPQATVESSKRKAAEVIDLDRKSVV